MNKKMLTIALAAALVFGVGSATAQNLGAAPVKKPTIGVIFNGEGIPGATEGGEGPLPAPKTCVSGPGQNACVQQFLSNCHSGGGTASGINGPKGEDLSCAHE